MSKEDYGEYMPVKFQHNQEWQVLMTPPENPSEMRHKFLKLFMNLSVPPPLTPWQKFQAVMGRQDLMEQHYARQIVKCCVELQRKLFQLETAPCPSHGIQPQDFGTETPYPPDPGMTMMQTPYQSYQSDPFNPPQQGSWVWMPGPSDPGMTTMEDSHSQHRFGP